MNNTGYVTWSSLFLCCVPDHLKYLNHLTQSDYQNLHKSGYRRITKPPESNNVKSNNTNNLFDLLRSLKHGKGLKSTANGMLNSCYT